MQKYLSLFFLILLPAIVLFDLLVYLTTKVPCLNCGGVAEFFRTSSLTGVVIAQSLPFWRKK
jgi:hypothetical protein